MLVIIKPYRLASALLTTTMLAGMPAMAQTAAPAGLETVTVSAQKLGEQDLQKVPVSIAVLDNEKLEDLHVSDFRDFVRFLPSVSFTAGGQGSSGGPGQGTISMRGVTNGADGNHSGPLPTVGVYLDEIPITTIGGMLDVPAYDLARVEALAGPQGTLFGASSEAGTLRLITNQPDPSKFAAGYEIEGNKVSEGGYGYGLRGFLNVPLDEHTAIRLVAWSQRDAGYIDNVHGQRTFAIAGNTIDNAALAEKDYNDTNKIGARLALGIDLDENWTATATVMGQLEKSNGIGGFDPSVGDLQLHHYFPEYAKDHWYQAALTVTGRIGNLDLTYATGYSDRRGDGAADYTDYAFWYDQLGLYFFDNAGNIVDPSQRIQFKDQFTKWSNELRLSSPATDRLRFVVGLFHERQVHNITQDYLIPAMGSDYGVPGWGPTIWLTTQQRIDRDLAAFTQVSYDITPSLTLIAGVRVFESNNSLEGFFGFSQFTDDWWGSSTGMASCPNPAVKSVLGGPCTNVDKHVYEWGETHKFNIQWQIDDTDMVYATYSTGFRPGGVNRVGSLPPYKSDTLDNYEIGWKTSWFANTLRFNGAAYWEDWGQFQFAFLGMSSLTQIANAGAARIQGVESDITWQIADGLTLSGAGSYNYARITKAYCGMLDADGNAVTDCADPQAPKNSALPSTPRFKGNLTGRYEFSIVGLQAHLQGSLVYQTKAYPDLRVQSPHPWDSSVIMPIRQMLGVMPAFATFDIATGIAKDNWSLDLAVQNLFDERGQIYRYAYCTTQVCGFQPYVLPTKPQFVSISFSQKF
jgi:outer membrane receptor protein involved in Fe transport